LISVRSEVQVFPGPPTPGTRYQYSGISRRVFLDA
jgi:hypothetical protein